MIDKLYINGIDIQEEYGFFLGWKIISMPTIKTNYQTIAGADSVIDLTKANGRVFYNQRTIQLNMIHPSDSYQEDLDALMAFHGETCKISFESDAAHYFSGMIVVNSYDTKTHKLSMTASVYPYRFEKALTEFTVKNNRTIVISNDTMPVVPKVDVVGGTVTLAWKNYSKSLSAGSYYIDELYIDKKGSVSISATFGTADSVKISFRKGCL